MGPIQGRWRDIRRPASPQRRALVGHHRGNLRRVFPGSLGKSNSPGHRVDGDSTLHRGGGVAGAVLGILRGLAGPGLGGSSRCGLCLSFAADGHCPGDFHQRRPLQFLGRHLSHGRLYHGGLCPPVLPRYPRRSSAPESRTFRGIGAGYRLSGTPHFVPPRLAQRHAFPAPDFDAECFGSHLNPGGFGLLGIRYRTDQGRGMGLRLEPRHGGCGQRNLVDRLVPRSGHRVAGTGPDFGGRILE